MDGLTAQLEAEVERLFGDPIQMYYEGSDQDIHSWSIHTRLFGTRARFDVELPDELVNHPYAIQIAMHDLAFQIMDRHEEDLLRGYEPYFAVDREHTTGIVRFTGPYKPEKWHKPQREDGKNVRIGKFEVYDGTE